MQRAKKYAFILLIIFLASFLRFLWLDKVPNAIGGDELTYVLTAKSMFLRWTDITGSWNPLSIFIFHYPPGEAQAELPYFLLLPIVGPFSLSLFTARILYAVLSVLSVFLIYLISKNLFSRNVAFFAAIIAAINPWFIYIGRTDYEVVPAVFFFLLSLYVFLVVKGWKILAAIPVLCLAFYSYIGTKLIFVPFVLFVAFYAYFYVNKRKYLREYLIVFIFSILLVLLFAFSLKNNSAGQRVGEILLPNNPAVVNLVNNSKQFSIQTPFMNLFDNKANVYFKLLSTKFLNATSFNYLFIDGDNFYNLRYGFFYIIDAFFLVAGLFFALNKKKESILLLLFVFLGIMPQVFHISSEGDILKNFAPHLALIFPFLIIFIGVGIAGIAGLFKNKKLLYLFFGIIGFVYLLFLSNFLYLYFFQFPLSDNFDFHVRPMSKYATLASKNGQRVILYSPKFRDEFKKYIFYTNALNNKNEGQIRTALNSKEMVFNNIEFSGCNNTIKPTTINKVVIYDYVCGALDKDYKHLGIPRLSDGGESYKIYNDKICSGFNLKPFPSGISIGDFSIENMSLQKFCETYITSFN